MIAKKPNTILVGPAKAFRDCLPLFQAFGDTGRQDIILLLADTESMNVKQIAEQLTLSRPTISHHLKTLRSAGLVTSARRGTENYYSLQIDSAVDLLKELLAQVETSCS